MENQILGWADVVMDTAEVAALVAAILLLFRVYRRIEALLRVVRRMDRRATDAAKSGYGRKMELGEAALESTGNRQPEPNRP
jgi:hypothetical protein